MTKERILITSFKLLVIGAIGAFFALVVYQKIVLPDRRAAAEAHYNTGIALAQQGQFSQALVHFEQAAQIDPHNATIRCSLATALSELGRVQESLPQFEQAVRDDPQNARTHNNYGNALRSLGRIDEAADHYQRALTIDPDYERARANLEQLQRPNGASQQPPQSEP